MEQHNQQHLLCQCNKKQQKQLKQQQKLLLQQLEQYHLQQLRQHCPHFCARALGYVNLPKDHPVGTVFYPCCDCHPPTPPTVDQTQDINEQNQDNNEENQKHGVTKVTMHKINVDKVTIGKPRGKENCDDVKLMRVPKKCTDQCLVHQQPSSDVPGDNVNATTPEAENLILLDSSQGEPKEVPVKLGLLQLPKSNKNKDPNEQNQNGVIAPVCSNVETNSDEPPRTAIVIVKPGSEKKDTGSVDMLVVCEGKKDQQTMGEEQKTPVKEQKPKKQMRKEPKLALQQICPPRSSKKPRKKSRKKRKTPPLPPQAFGPPPPLLCTRSLCSIT